MEDVAAFLSHLDTAEGDRFWYDKKNRPCCSYVAAWRYLKLAKQTQHLVDKLKIRIYIQEKLIHPCLIRVNEFGNMELNPEYEPD